MDQIESRTQRRSDQVEKKGCLNMTDTALSALVVAWATTMIATTLFVAALALSRVWDSAVYLQGLGGVLNLDV